MATNGNNSKEGLLDLIKELQSNKAYQRLKEKRKASPYIKDDSSNQSQIAQKEVEERDDDQAKWDKLIYDSLTKLEDDSLL